jgi:phosphoribosylglycinamide formyltransferase-1
MQAILDAIVNGSLKAEPKILISNNSKAYCNERARLHNIDTYHISSKTHPDSDEMESYIISLFDKYEIDTIVLAGYMKKLSPIIINQVNGRVLNIHPALLPKFGGEGMFGMNVHKAVIEANEKESGASVHLVDSEYDRGRILAQESVPVFPEDTPETLAERVLVIEHKIYAETLMKIANGEIEI